MKIATKHKSVVHLQQLLPKQKKSTKDASGKVAKNGENVQSNNNATVSNLSQQDAPIVASAKSLIGLIKKKRLSNVSRAPRSQVRSEPNYLTTETAFEHLYNKVQENHRRKQRNENEDIEGTDKGKRKSDVRKGKRVATSLFQDQGNEVILDGSKGIRVHVDLHVVEDGEFQETDEDSQGMEGIDPLDHSTDDSI